MTKKEIAQNFLELASKGQVRKAFELYVSDDFKHHNAYFKGDGHTLMTAMEENSRKTPNDLGAVVMHIFRFENNKIVELWDFGQAVPENMVNENGMF